jgi:hypothetical protein
MDDLELHRQLDDLTEILGEIMIQSQVQDYGKKQTTVKSKPATHEKPPKSKTSYKDTFKTAVAKYKTGNAKATAMLKAQRSAPKPKLKTSYKRPTYHGDISNIKGHVEVYYNDMGIESYRLK